MDIGFRISRLASHRRFVISVDLAFIVLQTTHELKCFFDGRQSLRGVLGAEEYPVIWIDMLDEAREVEDKLRGSPPEAHVLKDFCENFITRTNGVIMRPFIEGDALFKT